MGNMWLRGEKRSKKGDSSLDSVETNTDIQLTLGRSSFPTNLKRHRIIAVKELELYFVYICFIVSYRNTVPLK